MIKLLRSSFSKIANNPFLIGSLVMVVGSNFYNLGQFIYHFIAGKLLSKADYGDLASIISILGLLSIVQLSLGLTIIRFISSEKDDKKASNVAKWLNWWGLWIGIIVALLIFIASPWLVNFLKIPNSTAVYLIGPTVFLYVLLNTRRSILQGFLKFNQYVASLVTESWVKILISIPIFILGYKVLGAMFALIAGVCAALLITIFSLNKQLKGRRGEKPDVGKLLGYSLPVFVQGLALTSMYSTDLLLVKHFFPSESAGTYASLAILGRIVFFGASPIANVMFPIVSKKYSHGEPYHNIFYISAVSITALSVLIIVIYRFFSTPIIGTFFKVEYLDGASLLWWYGVFMGFLAVAQLFVQFYLSVGKSKIVSLFVVAAIVQAILILLMHQSLLQVIQLSILSVALLVLGLIVYFPCHDKQWFSFARLVGKK